MFLERGGVGVSVPGQRGAFSLWGHQDSLRIGCDHSQLGALVSLENLLSEVDRPQARDLPALFGEDAGASSGLNRIVSL